MIESITLGIIQGIVEWLPVSSEGVLVLVKIHIFNSDQELGGLIREALFLHLGTFFAALIYFRSQVYSLFLALLKHKKSSLDNKRILNFIIISTFLSGTIGLLIIKLIDSIESQLSVTGKIITLLIGLLLLITGILQLRSKSDGLKTAQNLNTPDALLLGFMQGLAALPGLSRSGLTISGLLLRKYDESLSLKLSFLMSLPIVFGGNIVLNILNFSFSVYSLISLFFAFVFGLLTIDLLLNIAKKINFGYFVISFSLLVFLSLLI